MKEGLYFRHIRYLRRGIVTLAIGVRGNWVQYSYSLCSPRDNFSKSKGEMISLGRLENERKRKVSGFRIDPDQSDREVFQKTEQEFFEAVRLKLGWIVPCGWLRKEQQWLLEENIQRMIVKASLSIPFAEEDKGQQQQVSGA